VVDPELSVNAVTWPEVLPEDKVTAGDNCSDPTESQFRLACTLAPEIGLPDESLTTTVSGTKGKVNVWSVKLALERSTVASRS
jgi:hypothetical protein